MANSNIVLLLELIIVAHLLQHLFIILCLFIILFLLFCVQPLEDKMFRVKNATILLDSVGRQAYKVSLYCSRNIKNSSVLYQEAKTKVSTLNLVT